MKNILAVKHEEKIHTIAWFFAFLADMDHDISFASLSGNERKTAEKFPSASRVKEFAAGRYCVKQAFALHNPDIANQNVSIGIGVWGNPFIEGSDANISIAHTGKCVIAVCSDGTFPLGVDIEDHNATNDVLILSQLSDAEKKMLGVFQNYSEGLHILWAAKEAVAKALLTGFRLSMPFFEVSAIVQKQDTWHIKFDAIGVLSATVISSTTSVIALALPTGSIVVNGFEEFRTMENITLQQKQSA